MWRCIFFSTDTDTKKHFHFKDFHLKTYYPQIELLAHKDSETNILNVDKETSQRYYADRSMSEHHTAPPTSEDLEIL